ncbi:MAG: proline-rich domain-containing protein [bacterium]|nr:proline-rich domain-containing protein [bacterium]
MTLSINQKHIPLAIIAGAVFISIFIIGQAFAQTDSNDSSDTDADTALIAYPVAELGNCKSKSECKSYCDQPGNMEACIAFAEKNNLMPEEDIVMAKKFLAVGGKGPGGCTGKDSCEAYCNDINNIDVCVAFAEESGMMPQKDLDEAKKVQAAIKRGVKPPACGGKKACDAYCEDSSHIEECIAFASEAGFMSPEEQVGAQKMLKAIKNGVKPLPCKGKEECDAYCGQEQNIDQCVAFAEAAGFMTKDEAVMAKKTRGKGPGGCQGKEGCDAFCNSSPDNEAICFNFGKENGLIPPEQLKQMEEGDKRFRDSFSNAPPEVTNCLENVLGKDNLDKFKSGAMRPTRGLGDKMAECFRQGDGQRSQNDGQNREPNGGPEGQMQRQPGSYGQGDMDRRKPPNPNDRQGMMPADGGQFSPNSPGRRGPEGFEGQRRPGDFQDGRPMYDQNYQPRQEQGLPCLGENCPPPSTGPQIRQMQRGEIQPMQQYNAPGTGYPPPGEASRDIQIQNPEGAPPPPTDGSVAPLEPTPPASIQPPTAPAQEPAPAPETTGLVSPNSMMASVINLLLPLFVRQ